MTVSVYCCRRGGGINVIVTRYLKETLIDKLVEATEFNVSDDVSYGAGNMPIRVHE
jgi:hypothetical protein